jgi:hypothetical protein
MTYKTASCALCRFCGHHAVVDAFPTTNSGFREIERNCPETLIWLACALCARAIKQQRWEELTDRIFTAFVAKNAPPASQLSTLRCDVAYLVNLFRIGRRE